MDDHFLIQVVKNPTRLNNILDLVFTNDTDMVGDITHEANKDLTDHHTLIVRTSLATKNRISVDKSRSFYTTSIHKYDMQDAPDNVWHDFRDSLDDFDWSFTDKMDPDQVEEHMAACLESAVADSFPLKRVEKSHGNRIPKKMRWLMKRRSKVARAIPRTKCCIALGKLNAGLEDIESTIKKSHDANRLEKETGMIANIKTDPAKFYAYAKSFAKTKSTIGPLIIGDQPVTDDTEIAELLKKQYEGVFSIARTTPKYPHPV